MAFSVGTGLAGQRGQTATGLQAGNYPVEFQNVPNYLAYPATLTVAVTNNGTTVVTEPVSANLHFAGYQQHGLADGEHWAEYALRVPAGGLLAKAPGAHLTPPIPSLLPDTYFIEYEPVSGWAKPASQAVQVYGGQADVGVGQLSAGQRPADRGPRRRAR